MLTIVPLSADADTYDTKYNDLVFWYCVASDPDLGKPLYLHNNVRECDTVKNIMDELVERSREEGEGHGRVGFLQLDAYHACPKNVS